MRNKGFSIIELAVVMTISTIIGLAIAFNFVTVHYLRSMTQDNIALSRETRIAMNHMTRVLRFAKPATIDDTVANQISATIEGVPQHLDFITSDTNIAYTRDTDNNTLEYTQGAEAAVVIAGGGERDIDITYFQPSWDSTEVELEIKLTAQKESRSVSLLTKIRPLGE